MIRVVIADDHSVVRMGLRALLDAAPDVTVVAEAADGAAALRACTDQRPDVVVMDLSMDGVDGLTAIRALSRRPDAPKILALTMHEESDYLVPALEAGANGYIVKSAASAELLDAIRSVAAGRTWVRAQAAGVLAAQVARRAAPDRERYEALSEREREVFGLLARGHTATRVGELLAISPKTVDTYKRRLNDKLGTSDRADYVRLALALDLLKPEP